MTQSHTAPDLAVAICTCNNQRTIRRSLESVQGLANRVVVVDSGSTDNTIDICRSSGAEVIAKEWAGYSQQKQFAIDRCRDHRWVLLMDSDESLEPELRENIRRITQQDNLMFAGWEIKRKVWFLGDWLHYVYQPDWVLRLVRGGAGKVSDDPLHERLCVEGPVGKLAGIMRHDSWADLDDLTQRQIRYAKTTGEHLSSGGTVFDMLLRPPASMFKQLILKRGFLDGWRGLIISGMTANFTMLKHAYIAANRLSKRDETQP